jgi:deoxyribodipyrimidine photolyase-related protein
MRSYYDELKSKKFKVDYFSIENDFKVSYEKKLEIYIKNNKVKEISLFEIEDKFFEKKILLLVKKLQIKINILKSPMFLTSRKEFKNYLDKSKKPFMANFYKINRVKLNILVSDDGKPRDGKWSFDEDNRKKLPKDIKLPEQPTAKITSHTKALQIIINKEFQDHPGNTNNFWLPTTRDDAEVWLDNFIKNKLNLFGDYEDAVSKKSNILFHSALSPLINIGLITPSEILIKLK